MAPRAAPRVTIGLPIYNGAELVHRAIEATLNQTFEDFELLVSDNCSSDATEEVCASYAKRDKRVVYTKTEHNIGAAGNYTRLGQLARGEYFKWLSHDDWMARDFIEKCLPIADQDREVGTVMPVVDVVDHLGVRQQSVTSYLGRAQWSIDRLEQYREMMAELAYCETHNDGLMMVACTYGFHRTSVLRRTRLLLPFISSDYVLAAELALFGRLVRTDATRSEFRLSTTPLGTSANFSAWDPMAIQRMLAPQHASRLDTLLSARMRHIAHVTAVMRSPLSPREKLLGVEAATRPMRARFAARLGRKRGRAASAARTPAPPG